MGDLLTGLLLLVALLVVVLTVCTALFLAAMVLSGMVHAARAQCRTIGGERVVTAGLLAAFTLVTVAAFVWLFGGRVG